MIRLLRLFAPRYAADSPLQLTPRVLQRWGIDALMLDLDNTLVAWDEAAPPQAIRDWVADLRRSGIPACIVSNNFSGRTHAISAALDLPIAHGRLKPSADKLRRALRILGTPPERTAMVGDQMLTDVLAGNRLGVPTVLTAPLAPYEPARIRAVRRFERLLLTILARRGLTPRTPGD